MAIPTEQFKSSLINAAKTARIFARGLAKDKISGDDLVQSALLRALENHEKFKPGTNMEAWLIQIIKNIFFDEKKSHAVSRTDQMRDDMNYERADSGSSQFDEMQIREINAFIQEELPDRERSVFMMWIEGLKTEEIANALDLSRANVGVIVCRVRKLIYGRFGEA